MASSASRARSAWEYAERSASLCSRPKRTAAAQKALHHRAQMNSLAALGTWTQQKETEGSLVLSH